MESKAVERSPSREAPPVGAERVSRTVSVPSVAVSLRMGTRITLLLSSLSAQERVPEVAV